MTMAKFNPWRRIAATAGAMVVVLLAAASVRFVMARGYFASVAEKTPAACHAVNGLDAVSAIVPGPLGRAYIAAGGGLYVYGNGVLARFAGTPKDFHPAALALADSGELNVVFRQNGVWEVSMFALRASAATLEQDQGIRPAGAIKTEKPPVVETVVTTKPIPPKLEELGRLSADTLTDPAGIAAVASGQFYLVNKHASHSGLGHWLDDTFLVPRATVQFFDSTKFITVAERLNAPAGVVASADGSHLYVAQELARNIVSFDRNPFVGALDHAALFSLPAAPRQITRAKDGSLIVAAWPQHGTGAVYRVRLDDKGVPLAADLLYATKTGEVTAAAEAGGHLLIGLENRLMDCIIP